MKNEATLFLVLAAAAIAQPVRPRIETVVSPIDGSAQPYACFVPRRPDPSGRFPLVISLHAAGSNHGLNLRRLFGLERMPGELWNDSFNYFPPFPDRGFLVAAPFARGYLGYQGIGETEVDAVVADMKRRYPVDDDRVYLAGIDRGGGGALSLALSHPDRWAGVVVVCPEWPTQADALAAREQLPNALGIAVQVFQGEADPVVPARVSRDWHRDLQRAGADVTYTEYPYVRHNAWTLAFEHARIFDWFAQHHRRNDPGHVRLVTRSYHSRKAWWLEIDGIIPGMAASIDAKFTAANRLRISTSNTDGFSLHLKGHPQATARLLEIEIDGTPLRTSERSFRRAQGQWTTGRLVPAADGKKPGAEGPISSAITGPHVYVYNEGHREIAERAARWSGGADRTGLQFPVISPLADPPAGSNLVLFGTAASNPRLAAMADRLPMMLDESAADYGLLFVYPDDGHYVLVNSGSPWWTDSVDTAPFRLLSGLPDFVLYRRSLKRILAQGYFDRNWRLEPADAERLRQSGPVRVR